MVKLVHHGAAASSGRNMLAWIPPSTSPEEIHHQKKEEDGNISRATSTTSELVYPSHAIVNIAELCKVHSEDAFHVHRTLRTSTTGFGSYRHVITSLCACTTTTIAEESSSSVSATKKIKKTAIVCGFSDGTIVLWKAGDSVDLWSEHVVRLPSEKQHRSVTSIDAIWIPNEHVVFIVAGCSGGVDHFKISFLAKDGNDFDVSCESLCNFAVGAVNIQSHESTGIVTLLGTAAPRHNKIHIFHQLSIDSPRHYAGFLPGHEDWITSLAWANSSMNLSSFQLLATASQDARIRLWKFKTVSSSETQSDKIPSMKIYLNGDSEDEEEEENFVEEDDEQGDARLHLFHDNNRSTSVHLEALLMGHEDHITSVCWHPHPQSAYGQDYVLISSSMDRMIIFWCPGKDGIWSPLSRVGSAGGILGGSVGCSLLGYCGSSIEPSCGDVLVGHAYGGSIHVWGADMSELRTSVKSSDEESSILLRWNTLPCITGHFDEVVDLCWETHDGSYLLTASKDQTVRLWAPVASGKEQIWVELARPQVHGYNMTTVTSCSTESHRHIFVSGADEKELRVFDSTNNCVRTLRSIAGLDTSDQIERVDRAYIPSLGLSNKATASDGAEEDVENDVAEKESETSQMKLPRERDLGAVSLWPEKQKLFGHDTELYCVTSTAVARSAIDSRSAVFEVLVASSCKARNPEDARIRLWDVHAGTCLQVLESHKSTVSTLAFSPDGQYLLSSGKDRRLSLFRRLASDGKFHLVWAKDSAHKRIVWSVHFCPFNSAVAVSSSRDGCIRLWKVEEDGEGAALTGVFSFSPAHESNGKPDSVNAVAFAPVPLNGGALMLALGLESGFVELWKISNDTASLALALDPGISHISTVTKLAWKPAKSEDTQLTLASCSLDHGVRIYEIDVESL